MKLNVCSMDFIIVLKLLKIYLFYANYILFIISSTLALDSIDGSLVLLNTFIHLNKAFFVFFMYII